MKQNQIIFSEVLDLNPKVFAQNTQKFQSQSFEFRVHLWGELVQHYPKQSLHPVVFLDQS